MDNILKKIDNCLTEVEIGKYFKHFSKRNLILSKCFSTVQMLVSLCLKPLSAT